MPRIPKAAYQRALARSKRWLDRPDVVAVGLGHRSREGEATKKLAIVVTVRWKRKPKRLRQLSIDPLPEHVRTRFRNKTYKIPVDIESARGALRGKTQGLVGRRAVAGQFTGVVGAVVRRQTNRFVMIAAHVARRLNRRVEVDNASTTVSGMVTELHLGNDLDHALVEADSPLSATAGRLVGNQTLTGIRAWMTLAIGETVLLRTAAGNVVITSVRRLGESVLFNVPGGTIRFNAAVVTDLSTVSGDSGTLLYDNQLRAVGTLIGRFTGSSYFVPCEDSFARLNLNLSP